MAKKGRDTRPTRAKQKARSTANKIKQMEVHVTQHPKDKYGKEKLDRARKGNSRATYGAGPQPKIPEIGRQKQSKRR
jgi:hypothetical protein